MDALPKESDSELVPGEAEGGVISTTRHSGFSRRGRPQAKGRRAVEVAIEEGEEKGKSRKQRVRS